MQQAFFLILQISLNVSVLVDCKPSQWDSEQLEEHQQTSFNAGTDILASIGHFYIELNGSMKKRIHREFLVFVPVQTNQGNFVKMFRTRRKRFLCEVYKKKLYNFKQKDSEDSLFRCILFNVAEYCDISKLLKLDGAELRVVHRESASPSTTLQKISQRHFVRRQRRSEEVNPSDPLRSESHPSHAGKDHKDPNQRQLEPDQAGAVSKETITSVDDPLQVLQSNGPISPVKTNIADRVEQD